MSSRFLLVTVLVLCTLFVGAQYHPAPPATTSVMMSEGVGPTSAEDGCNSLVPRNVESDSETECKPFADMVEWTTSKSLTSHTITYTTLTSQTAIYNTFISQTASDNTLSTYPASYPTSSPTLFIGVTTITCTAAAAATAMPLDLGIVPFIGVAIFGAVEGLVL